MDPLPFDELNKLKAGLSAFVDEQGKLTRRDDLLDLLEDLFLLAYASGVETANATLNGDYRAPLDTVMRTVDAEVAGETWRDRVRDYYDNGGTIDDIARIADTESHRDANAGAVDAAQAAGAKFKTWITMQDDRVRDTHEYLEAMSIPMGEDFYTFDGDHAPAPGQFALPENNINCRCFLIFS